MPPARITPITKQTERERKKMILETAIWNGKKTKVIGIETFNSAKDLLDFMKELQTVDKDASYTVTAVRKDK